MFHVSGFEFTVLKKFFHAKYEFNQMNLFVKEFCIKHIGEMSGKNSLTRFRNKGNENTKKHACIIMSLSFSSIQHRRESCPRKISVTLSGKVVSIIP